MKNDGRDHPTRFVQTTRSSLRRLFQSYDDMIYLAEAKMRESFAQTPTTGFSHSTEKESDLMLTRTVSEIRTEILQFGLKIKESDLM